MENMLARKKTFKRLAVHEMQLTKTIREERKNESLDILSTALKEIIAEEMDTSTPDFAKQCRGMKFHKARMLYCALMEQAGFSHADIAKTIDRDRTTITYACKTFVDIVSVEYQQGIMKGFNDQCRSVIQKANLWKTQNNIDISDFTIDIIKLNRKMHKEKEVKEVDEECDLMLAKNPLSEKIAFDDFVTHFSNLVYLIKGITPDTIFTNAYYRKVRDFYCGSIMFLAYTNGYDLYDIRKLLSKRHMLRNKHKLSNTEWIAKHCNTDPRDRETLIYQQLKELLPIFIFDREQIKVTNVKLFNTFIDFIIFEATELGKKHGEYSKEVLHLTAYYLSSKYKLNNKMLLSRFKYMSLANMQCITEIDRINVLYPDLLPACEHIDKAIIANFETIFKVT